MKGGEITELLNENSDEAAGKQSWRQGEELMGRRGGGGT